MIWLPEKSQRRNTRNNLRALPTNPRTHGLAISHKGRKATFLPDISSRSGKVWACDEGVAQAQSIGQ
jgi:hypothetical protein